MLLTITTTRAPATDLGYLLHKNPERLQSFPLSFGARTSSTRRRPRTLHRRAAAGCRSDRLVRRKGGPAGEGHALEQYVNDRPYVASSFLERRHRAGVRTAMTGRSKERQELAEARLPLEAKLAVVPVAAARSSSGSSSNRSATVCPRPVKRSTRSSPSGGRARTSRCVSKANVV